MLHHIKNGEVILHKRGGQAAKSNRQQQGLSQSGRASQGYPLESLLMGANQRKNALSQSDAQGKDEGKVSEFRDHGSEGFSYLLFDGLGRCFDRRLVGGSAGMGVANGFGGFRRHVILVMLG